MTEITVFKKNDAIVSILFKGHTGAGVSGEDLVCAALSSIAQTAVLGLIDVAKIDARYERDELKGTLWMTLPNNLTKKSRRDADMILGTLMCGVYDLQKGYPKFIKTEVTACL
ncbi:MAG: ribosomal-processing cysteine protease Prp [Clostridia bacterium]